MAKVITRKSASVRREVQQERRNVEKERDQQQQAERKVKYHPHSGIMLPGIAVVVLGI